MREIIKNCVVLIIIIFSLFITGCNNRVTKEIGVFIRNNCNFDEPCTVKLSEITSFSWNEFYFFDKSILDGEANKILGKQIFDSPFSGNTNKLVFLRDGNPIHSEEQVTNIEMKLDGEVYFEIDQSKKYERFLRDSEFKVKILKSTDGKYYKLSCTNCSENLE